MPAAEIARAGRLRLNTVPQVHYCPPEWVWQPRPLPDYDLWFVESGRGWMRLSGKSFTIGPGDCFLFRPGDVPVGTQDPEHRLVVFACHFTPLDAAGREMPLPPVPYPTRIRELDFFAASAHRIERLWRRGDDAARAEAHTLMQGLLWQLWDDAGRPPETVDAPIQQLAQRIRREPGADWSLDGMAAAVHLSRAQLVRRFRQATGSSPANFVITARIERARQLLLETDMTLEQVARLLGYGDVYFFCRQFKKVTGQTPGEARRGRR